MAPAKNKPATKKPAKKTKPGPKPGSEHPVYLAGPMFSDADVAQQRLLRTTLEAANIDVYLPLDDGIEVARVMDDIASPLYKKPDLVLGVVDFARRLVFALDVYQVLERCQAVVLNLDGRVPDEGSVMEASLAWTAGKPVVIFKTTSITMLGGFDNPMVSGLGMNWTVVTELKDLPKAVDDAIVAYPPPAQPFVPGAHAKTVVDLGRAVWDRMQEIEGIIKLDPPKVPAALKKLKEELKKELKGAGLYHA